MADDVEMGNRKTSVLTQFLFHSHFSLIVSSFAMILIAHYIKIRDIYIYIYILLDLNMFCTSSICSAVIGMDNVTTELGFR